MVNNEAYQNFINTLQSEYTQKTYRRALRNFLTFLKIENNDCSKLLEYDVKTIENYVRDYILDMRRRDLSPSTIDCNCAALKHFFDINDFDLRWSKKLLKYKGSKDNRNKKENRPYSLTEIRQLLNAAQDQRAKVMMLLMASGGIRIGAFLSLRIRNLIPIDKYGIYKIIVYEDSSSQHYTFCTQECRREIDNYLEYRKRNGEILKPESPLIREQFNTRNRVGSAKPRFLSDRGLTKIIGHVLEIDSGIRNNQKSPEENYDTLQLEEQQQNKNMMAKRRHETSETHSFRRFFETTAIKEGLSPLYVNILMNHEIGLEKSYFKPTVSDLLEGSDKMTGYLGIMEALTINEEHRLSKQVQTLQEKNHGKDYIIQGKLSEKDEQIKALQESIKLLSDTVNRTLLSDHENKIVDITTPESDGKMIVKGIELKPEINHRAIGQVKINPSLSNNKKN